MDAAAADSARRKRLSIRRRLESALELERRGATEGEREAGRAAADRLRKRLHELGDDPDRILHVGRPRQGKIYQTGRFHGSRDDLVVTTWMMFVEHLGLDVEPEDSYGERVEPSERGSGFW